MEQRLSGSAGFEANRGKSGLEARGPRKAIPPGPRASSPLLLCFADWKPALRHAAAAAENGRGVGVLVYCGCEGGARP
jgi:hypothetical protein